MGIWESLRRFSSKRGSQRRDSKRKGKVTKTRDLRVEQCEARVLLSITPQDPTYFKDSFGNGYFVDPKYEPILPAPQTPTTSENARYPLADTFKLHSNPGASKVIYLDFTGHTTTGTLWNTAWGIDPIVTPPYDEDGDVNSFSTAELQLIQDTWDIVSEDYLPFEVDVTTEDPGVEALRNTGGGDTQWGIRVVIGEDQANTGAGGIAYISSFSWDSDTPTFVFNQSLVGVSEAASHEVGHTLGLYHDGYPLSGYYPGHGTGPTGWAPIMGVGYYQPVVQWSRGEYPAADNQEDDLAIITTGNGFGYRADDHGDSRATASDLNVVGGTIAADDGFIGRTNDVDYFLLDTAAGDIDLTINPFYRSPDLDILATLYDENGAVVATSNPIDALNARITVNVTAGEYYLAIDGTGKTPVAGHPGYSDYGSLGYYSITGTVPLTVLTPPELVAVIPNAGEIMTSGTTLNVAPRELTLRFNENQSIDAATLGSAMQLGSIVVLRSGGDGVFAGDTGRPNTAADIVVPLGWIGIGDASNEVILRFTENLPDDNYRVLLVGAAGFALPAGTIVPAGITVPAVLPQLTNASGIPVHNGVNVNHDFELDLGPQITSVVPQPVQRRNYIQALFSKSPLDQDLVVLSMRSASGTVTTRSFEFDSNNSYNQQAGHVRVPFTAGNLASAVAGLTAALSTDLVAFGVASVTQVGNAIQMDKLAEGAGSYYLDLSGLRSGAIALHDGPIDVAETQRLRRAVDVYFNLNDLPLNVPFGDPLYGQSVLNPALYQLIATQETADPTDDVVILPTSIEFNPTLGRARLWFGNVGEELSDLVTAAGKKATGSFRLRIGNEYMQVETKSLTIDPALVGSSYETAALIDAVDLGAGSGTSGLGGQSVVIGGTVGPPSAGGYDVIWPGGVDEPGHRWLPANQITDADNHVGGPGTGDAAEGIVEYSFWFPKQYVSMVNGRTYYNYITETQKQRAREVFELYARYLGVQFREVTTGGDISIWTANAEGLGLAPGSWGGEDMVLGKFALMDVGGEGETGNLGAWNSEFGGNWFRTAFHEVGHALGYAHTYDLPGYTTMGESAWANTPGTTEATFPGDADIIHGQYMYRRDSNDINMYTFTLDKPGQLSAETIAQRLNSSLLNTVITIFDSQKKVIARNDDYYGDDSFVSLHLAPGKYYVGVTAQGNSNYNPEIEDSGVGGGTQGVFQLRLEFAPDRSDFMADADGRPTLIDGDLDGTAGGVYDYWFNVQDVDHTIYVDKDSQAVPANQADWGTMAYPYTKLSDAVARASTLTVGNNEAVVRAVGNLFFNDSAADAKTLQDNVPYEIGYDVYGTGALSDGLKLEIPKQVTVVIDGGSVLKLNGANIDVGSSAQGIDRSLGSLQVLGTPQHSVYFTSHKDQGIGKDTQPLNTSPSAGDWGGLVFRNLQDYDTAGRTVREREGIFLNYVNHADIRYGGGLVNVNGVTSAYAPIYLSESRPTVTFNTITRSAHAAMSADPDSFLESEFEQNSGAVWTADYERVGPDIYGNTLYDLVTPEPAGSTTPIMRGNTLNGMFVRVLTRPGQPLEELTVSARFDDLDIVHIIGENLQINGTPGGSLNGVARPHARLAIDPGTIVKFNASYIEAQTGGGQLIAEGVKGYPVIFTSLYDTTYGAGATFDTNNDAGRRIPQPGDWGGVHFAPDSTGSIDRARIYYGGGRAAIEGAPAQFQTIEIRQADVRVANSLFQYNQAIADVSQRVGRGDVQPGTIFVRGAQPVIVGNIFRDNAGSLVNIDAGSLKALSVSDWGRTTGTVADPAKSQYPLDAYVQYADNQGPLVRANRMINNNYNGMLVRGGLLNWESVWDDTDIVHILTGQITIPNYHTYGGLSLRSSPDESLVVKLMGANAGFVAAGRPVEVEDRIGGILQVIGTPGHPVVLTSLLDDSVGAGFNPSGSPVFDTNNTVGTPSAGNWRGLTFEEYSHDRNVAVLTENEAGYGPADINAGLFLGAGAVLKTQTLGELTHPINEARPDDASDDTFGTWEDTQKTGDENLRLGFTVDGFIRASDPGDLDVYSFKAKAGTEVWIDIDQTAFAMDTVVELLNADGTVVAWSDDSRAETLEAIASGTWDPTQTVAGHGLARVMQRDQWEMNDVQYFNVMDYGSTNTRDAGFRAILPGVQGTDQYYYVRVRAKVAMIGVVGSKDMADGQTFSITNRVNDIPVTKLFQFVDLDAATPKLLAPGAIPFTFHSTAVGQQETAVQIAARLRIAINNAGLNISIRQLDDPQNPGVAQLVIDSNDPAHQLLSFDRGDTKLAQINPTGAYQLQVRLRELQEVGGSTVRGAMISYANVGIDVQGLPMHSPLAGETAMTGGDAGSPQNIGNLVRADQEAISFTGNLTNNTDVDWYRFQVDMGGSTQQIQRATGEQSRWPVNIDVDYAEGLRRPDTSVWVFDSAGRLILIGRDSNLADDTPRLGQGNDLADLSRGSSGELDPYIGSVYLPEGPGVYYNMAVTNNGRVPTALNDPLVRLEPVNSLQRVAEDHMDSYNNTNNVAVGPQYTLFNGAGDASSNTFTQELNLQANPFTLGDVVMWVNTVNDLYTVDPYTGRMETDVSGYTDPYIYNAPGYRYQDLGMTNDGRLYAITSDDTSIGTADNMVWLDTGNANNANGNVNINIRQYRRDPANLNALVSHVNQDAVDFSAMAHSANNSNRYIFAIGNSRSETNNIDGLGNPVPTKNLMFLLDENGNPIDHPDGGRNARLNTDCTPFAVLQSGSLLQLIAATQIATPPSFASRGPTNPYNTQRDIADGDWFSLTVVIDPGTGATQTEYFEFDSGPDLYMPVNDSLEVRDGQTLTVNGVPFEFNSGPVLEVASASLRDGDYIRVDGPAPGTGDVVEIEFDTANDGLQVAGRVRVAGAGTAAAILAAATGPLAANGVTLTANGNRLSFEGENSVSYVPDGGGSGITTTGDYIVLPGSFPIVFEETDAGSDPTKLGNSIVTEVIANSPVKTASYAHRQSTGNRTFGDRITFRGATSVTVGQRPGVQATSFRMVAAAQSGLNDNTRTPIYFDAADGADVLATRAAQAISTAFGTVITSTGGSVSLPGYTYVESDPNPLTFQAAAGTGGNITGMAFLPDDDGTQRMYVVDDAGGLFEVMPGAAGDWYDVNAGTRSQWGARAVNPQNSFRYWTTDSTTGPTLNYIAPIASLTGGTAVFTGLTAGPKNVEGGKYAHMLFATYEANNRTYVVAIDRNGNRQPVYLNSQTDLPLVDADGDAVSGVRGVAFSNIDYNLWHATESRGNDDGHGVYQNWDLSRRPPNYNSNGTDRLYGETSMYFGLEDASRTGVTGNPVDMPGSQNYAGRESDVWGTYNMPGGAHGTMTTDAFSLKGYHPYDKPTLYFTYFAETENNNDWDGVRVYVSNDNVNWSLVASNTDMNVRGGSSVPDDPDSGVYSNGGVELVDDGQWRQARIDLSEFAGLDGLRLRFDFSTASDMQVGDGVNTGRYSTGTYLQALPGWQLRDGDYFEIDGQRFEFDMGYAMTLPNSAGIVIQPHETFQVLDNSNHTVTFEFTRDGTYTPTNVPIAYNEYDTTLEVMRKIREAVNSASANNALVAVNAYAYEGSDTAGNPGARLYFTGAQSVVRVTLTTAVAIDGDWDPFLARRVPITADMSTEQVSQAMATAVDKQFSTADLNTLTTSIKTTGYQIIQVGSVANTDGSRNAGILFNHGDTLEISAYQRLSQFDAVGVQLTQVFEFTTDGTVSNAAYLPITFVGNETVAQMRLLIVTAINDWIANANVALQVASYEDGRILLSPMQRGNGQNGGGYVWQEGGPVGAPIFKMAKLADGKIDQAATNPRWELNQPGLTMPTPNGGVMHVIGHTVTDAGALPFADSLWGDTPDYKNFPNPPNDRFRDMRKGQNNDYEGFYIDDVIIGFAERGEMVMNSSPNTDFQTVDGNGVLSGNGTIGTTLDGQYQVEIRRGQEFARKSDFDLMFVTPPPMLVLSAAFDTNDRFAEGYTLDVPDAANISQLQKFTLSDGVNKRTFQFYDPTIPGTPDPLAVQIRFTAGWTATRVATEVVSAINSVSYYTTRLENAIKILAKNVNLGNPTSPRSYIGSSRVDLDGAVWAEVVDAVQQQDIVAAQFNPYLRYSDYPTGDWTSESDSDENHYRAQGMLILENNQILNSASWGIQVQSTRDGANNAVHPGSVNVLQEPNLEREVPSLVIQNNVVANSGTGGIRFAGDDNLGGAPQPLAAVPFGRIVNNTVVNPAAAPSGTGIRVEQNAAPTVLNNIVANFTTGIFVDASSQWDPVNRTGTVTWYNAFKNTTNPMVGAAIDPLYDLVLSPTAPLFVDEANGNYYPAPGSDVIDSSRDGVEDRFNMTIVRNPLGIPESPIKAPLYDLYGQTRADAPAVQQGAGAGSDFNIDRGAIDRVDFYGPTARIVDPVDLVGLVDNNGDRDPAAHDVRVTGKLLTKFTLQLSDAGIGIDDRTVAQTAPDGSTVAPGIRLWRDYNPADLTQGLLVQNVHYFVRYNATNDTIDLVPATGVWPEGSVYTIILSQTIRDLAGNDLQYNRSNPDETRFTISVSGLDFGDAPDPAYPSLLTHDGPRHLFANGWYLGAGVDTETDARIDAQARGDQKDDGILFTHVELSTGTGTIDKNLDYNPLTGDPWLVRNGKVFFNATASQDGYLDVFIDWNGDGDFEDVQEKVYATSQLIAKGGFELSFDVPDSSIATVAKTYARFRYSSAGGLGPTGEAEDGEVEDYQVRVVDRLEDFGDLPDGLPNLPNYPTLANDGADPANPPGARHSYDPLNPLTLGDAWTAKVDGQPSPLATADQADDGVVFDQNASPLFSGAWVAITVKVGGTMGAGAYLTGWLDAHPGDQGGATPDLTGLEGTEERLLLRMVGDTGPGSNTLSFNSAGDKQVEIFIPSGVVPLGQESLTTFARFRLSHDSAAIQSPAGPATGTAAPDGEVEDYRVTIVTSPKDYGDAPDGLPGLPNYPTLKDRPSDPMHPGAVHERAAGVYLGNLWDYEDDGTPGSHAAGTAGDLNNTTHGDLNDAGISTDDGLILYNNADWTPINPPLNSTDPKQEWRPGTDARVLVTAKGGGILKAWVDWNRDGDWLESNDADLDNPPEALSMTLYRFDGTSWVPVAGQTNVTAIELSNDPSLIDGNGRYRISVSIPPGLASKDTFARFRYTTSVSLASADQLLSYGALNDGSNTLPNGEVEDYAVKIVAGDARISGRVYEDLNGNGMYDSGTLNLPQVNPASPGSWILSRGDDISTQMLDFGFNFQFYGRNYTHFFVNSNGNVSFEGPASWFSSSGFPQAQPMLAPFWADVDMSGSAGGHVTLARGVSERGNPYVQIDWVDVGYYRLHNEKKNSFALYIEDDPGGDIVAFIYRNMQWTTGDLNGGRNGFGGQGAQIGFDGGTGFGSVSVARPASAADLQTLQPQYVFRLNPLNGQPAGPEPGQAGVLVWLETDDPIHGVHNGVWDSWEPRTYTAADGSYQFSNLFSNSTYYVYQQQPGWSQTYPVRTLKTPLGGGAWVDPGNPLRTLEGRTFTLTDSSIPPRSVTFEFTSDALVTGQNRPVQFIPAGPGQTPSTPDELAAAIANAVNLARTQLGLQITASAVQDNVALGGAGHLFTQDVGGANPLGQLTSPAAPHQAIYEFTLDAQEVVAGANFGNFSTPTVSLSPTGGPAPVINVIEGNNPAQPTTVQVPVYLSGAFGAPVTVTYRTAAYSSGNPATAVVDYRPVSPPVTTTFTPFSRPSATWELTRLTHNDANNYDFSMTDRFVVWEGFDGNHWQIYVNDDQYLYNGTTPDPDFTVPLTTDAVDHRTPMIAAMANGDSVIVWTALDSVTGRRQVYLHKVEMGPNGLNRDDLTGTDGGKTIQITFSDLYDAENPRISEGGLVTWTSNGQVYVLDLDGVDYDDVTPLANKALIVAQSQRVSPSYTRNNVDLRVAGSKVIWVGSDGTDREIFLYDGSRSAATGKLSGTTIQVTSNTTEDARPQISGSNDIGYTLVWESRDVGTGTYDLYMAEIAPDTQVTILPDVRTFGMLGATSRITNTSVDEYDSQVSRTGTRLPDGTVVDLVNNIVFTGLDALRNNLQIYYYNASTPAQPPVNISGTIGSNNPLRQIYSEHPQVRGNEVVWHTYDAGNWEVYYTNLAVPNYIPVNVSNNSQYDWWPQIGSNQMLVWKTYEQSNYQVVKARPGVPQATGYITVQVNGDTGFEADEQFYVELLSASVAGRTLVIPVNQVTVNILNDDGDMDYGDAPSSYPVKLSDNAARHLKGPLYLGTSVIAEADGMPSVTASAATDDDGVWVTPLVRGQYANAFVQIAGLTQSAPKAYFNGWIDLNNDGDWSDPEEQVYRNEEVVLDLTEYDPATGRYKLSDFPVPVNATLGQTFARFRLTRDAIDPLDEVPDYLGMAPTGEVEDYQVMIGAFPEDLGDAPDPKYPTDLANRGARHRLSDKNHPFLLGDFVDMETTAWASANADADQYDDGMTYTGVNLDGYPANSWVAGYPVTLQVRGIDRLNPTGTRYLNVWIDYNGDGDWADTGEHVVNEELDALDLDINNRFTANFTLVVPEIAKVGATFMRVRLSDVAGLGFDGPASSQDAPYGEVEDYRIQIERTPEDYGDAPDAVPPDAPPQVLYPTLRAHNGAHHRLLPNFGLGATVTGEQDGKPTGSVLYPSGDSDDGVTVPSEIITGAENAFTVTTPDNGGGGYLSAWIDLNGDGDWKDAGELLTLNLGTASGTSLLLPEDAGSSPNTYTITFTPPNGPTVLQTWVRFRYSHTKDLASDGPAPGALVPDGEVEDYPTTLVGRDAEIRGSLFIDLNYNGVWNSPTHPDPSQRGAEIGDAGRLVYLDVVDDNAFSYTDVNVNGIFDSGVDVALEPWQRTGTDGSYAFTGLLRGTYEVRQEVTTGWEQTTPNPAPITLAAKGKAENVLFGNYRLPEITIQGVTVEEGNAGTTIANVIVRVTGASGADGLSVQYQTLDGTAHSPADYTAIPLSTLSLVGQPGGLYTVAVQITTDTNIDVEPVKTFTLRFSSAQRAALKNVLGGPAVSTLDVPVTILDDDTQMDYGDSPASFGNPRHVLGTGLSLGADVEPDLGPQPSAAANLDVDNGVTFLDAFVPGLNARATVVATVPGLPGTQARLDAWFDWNRNNQFDAGEQISQAVTNGSTNVNIAVPGTAAIGTTYARFRITSAGIAGPDGLAADGEVEDYVVLVDNTFVLSSGILTVMGGNGNDDFRYTAGDTLTVSLNGDARQYDSSEVTKIVFQGGLGKNTATLVGSDSGVETLELWTEPDLANARPYNGLFEKTGGVRVEMFDVSTFQAVSNGGNDTARFHGTAGGDKLTVKPRYSAVVEPLLPLPLGVDATQTDSLATYSFSAQGFKTLNAWDGGAGDQAALSDSAGDDTLAASPRSANLSNSAGTYAIAVSGYQSISVTGSIGTDNASLAGSAGGDRLEASPTLATLSSLPANPLPYMLQARSFDTVTTDAYNSSVRDIAYLLDSLGVDRFEASPNLATLSGSGFRNVAQYFDEVHGYSSGNSSDLAILSGSNSADAFNGKPDQSTLTGPNGANPYYLRARGFRTVKADVKGGNDVVNLYDSYRMAWFDAYAQKVSLTDKYRYSYEVTSTDWNLYDKVYAFAGHTGNRKKIWEAYAYNLTMTPPGSWVNYQ